jgi:uncharacterized protein YndB with AHSA1/START domain
MAAGAAHRTPIESGEFVFSRVIDAPRQRVWRAFTEAEQLAHWWGPKGFKLHVEKLDLRVGGIFLYRMRSAGGHEMWGRFIYREIAAPERLVYVLSFSDPQGGITRAPMSETWPLQMLNIVTFSERDDRTTVTLRGRAINATDEERATYVAGFESMQAGFGGTFDQLAAYLAKA